MRERLTRQELAARFRVSTRTVDRMVADGELPHIRVRSRVLFLLSDIEEWERRQRAASQPAA